jgi:hypothetical protein
MHSRNNQALKHFSKFLFGYCARRIPRSILIKNKYLGLHFLKYALARKATRTLGYKVNIQEPRSFNERILHRIIYDRDPLLKVVCDKQAVKTFIAARISPDHVVPLIGVWKRASDIDFDQLPNEFVLKPNHGSGMIKIVRDKSKEDLKLLRFECKLWLMQNYFNVMGEWGYKDLPRRIIAEPLIAQENGESCPEVFVFVFNGRAEFIRITHETNNELSGFYTDRDGNEILSDNYFVSRREPNLALAEETRSQLISLAEVVARDFSFMRVDFYWCKSQVFIGELTPYHGAGLSLWSARTDVSHRRQMDDFIGEYFKPRSSAPC